MAADSTALDFGSSLTAGPRFVGRTAESRRLTEALARPAALVLVEGEAGIGKSRLIAEAAAGRRGGRWLMIGCPPFREVMALGPVVEAIRRAVVGEDDLGLSDLAGALRPLFPEWCSRLPPAPEQLADPGAAQYRVFRALGEVLESLRIQVLVVEDAQWADDQTLDFLLYLAARPAPRPALVVSYRPDELPGGSAVLRLSARLSASNAQIRIELTPLELAQTAGLISSMLGRQRASAEFVEDIQRRTEGVPLAVEESVRQLRDRAPDDRIEWTPQDLERASVPPTIRDAVMVRVSGLGPEAVRVLRAAAVLDRPASEQYLIAVGGLSEPRTRIAVDCLVQSGLLEEVAGRRLAFRHKLAAQTVYDALPREERRQLHQTAGDLIAGARPDAVAWLAHHYRSSGDIGNWSRYAEQVADRALATGDHQTALRSLHDLLAESTLPGESVARVAQKMPILAITGYVGRADLVRTLQAVLDRRSLTVADRADIRGQLGRLLMHAGRYLEGAAEIERAVPDLAGRPLAVARAMTTLGSPAGASWPVAVHRSWLDRAAEVLPSSAPARARLPVLIDHATALLDMGAAEGWQAAAALPTTATDLESTLQQARARLNIANAAMRWGRYGEARRLLTAGLELADRRRLDRLRNMIVAVGMRLDWLTGDWSGLTEHAAELTGVDDDPLIQLEMRLATDLVALATGEATAEQRLLQIIGEGNRRGIVDLPLEPAAMVAGRWLTEGRVAEALDLTDDYAEVVLHKEIWIWATEILPVRVAVLVAAGRLEEADQLVQRFERGLGGADLPAPRVSLEVCHGHLAAGQGESRAAAAFWAKAAAGWRQLPRPYFELLALEQQAVNLFACSNDEEAGALLSGVYRRLSDLGAWPDAARVARILTGHGIAIRHLWRGGRRGYGDQLSPRELEVCRLVLAGLTTPEIARMLTRSPKTIAAQLNSAMRKYDVSSRTALAVSLTEAGIRPAQL